jgi:predicted flavoprotein YhiN
MTRKQIVIIGGGPAGMMAADVLSPFHDVHIYEKEKGVGQKFLVAGKGGFNITNGLKGNELATKYTPEYFLKKLCWILIPYQSANGFHKWVFQLLKDQAEGFFLKKD